LLQLIEQIGVIYKRGCIIEAASVTRDSKPDLNFPPTKDDDDI
jgi:hypothetical protein